ncbi:hypothetical protein AB0J90_22540 [Micromonospora sp. NPDC049523]|uniref:hypothetical protein n=1 Tax=Micromonospora sp. NPDC049523 TaxID=3155921 RepID=UPI003420F356
MTDLARSGKHPGAEQAYDPRSGDCPHVPEVAVPAYRIRRRDNVVEVGTRQES